MRIHRGFYHSFLSIKDRLTSTLKTIERRLRQSFEGKPTWFNNGRLVFTGHSAGAALAGIASMQFPCAGVVTFGEPRWANTSVRDYVNELYTDQMYRELPNRPRLNERFYLRVVNVADPICGVPLWLWGYRHCGHRIYLDRNNRLNDNSNILGRVVDRILRGFCGEWASRVAHSILSYKRKVDLNQPTS